MISDRYFGLSGNIAKWKDISEFEKQLGKAAENSWESRRLYAEYYRQLDSEYYENGKELALRLYENNQDPTKPESFEETYIDMVYCLHRYGLSYQDYCIYCLHNKSEHCRKLFIADKMRYHYCDILNSKDVSGLMTDKYACYTAYSQFFKRKVVPILSNGDREEFLKFIKENDIFIYKPLTDHSGHGVSLVKTQEIDTERWFDETISERPGIIEELIIQGSEMSRLNPKSVNTCRVMTFTIGEKVNIIGVTLRIGVGDSIKDNAGSGGIYASVDSEHGILQSDAKNYNNQHYLFHPTTKKQIIGFRLPEWDMAKDLIQKMATSRPGTTMVAWDIAYSNKGWCMVEANENGDWGIIQSNLEKGKKEELYGLMDKYFKTIRK